MDIKLKNKKLLQFVRKFYFIIVLIALIIGINAYYDYNYTKWLKNDIGYYKNDIAQLEGELKLYDDSQSKESKFNEKQWLSKYIENINVNIYSQTNYLKKLKESSQDELNKLSTFINNTKENKFFILDTSNGKYLTNANEIFDEKTLEEVKQGKINLEYNISKNAYIYSITDSTSSPAVKNFNEHLKYIDKPEEYIEAYWVPNTISKDDELYKNIEIINYEKQHLQERIKNLNTNLISKQNLDKKYTYEYIIKIVILLILLFLLYSIGYKDGVKCLKESVFIKKIISNKKFLSNKNLGKKCKWFIIISIIAFILLLNMINSLDEAVCIFSIYLIIIIIYMLNFIKNVSRIIEGTDKIIEGNLSYEIKEKGEKNLVHLAQNINKIKNGFKVSLDDQFKNEKLKSELVANVSHDLKTPLTSIINYTDILMREDITDEERDDYIKILNSKSLKLKSLIEDLFEVSKINSGKIELNKEDINLVELIRQSIGEFSNSQLCADKNLSFIFKTFSENIIMDLDGKKMSRVFENLITNSLKYSMENTRVYIYIEEIKGGISISFKNISKFALDFDKDEIFERFSRGDKSRNSNVEGNGLGLNIAKSLVECHNGNMNVELDGDLFKVFIKLYY